MSRKWQIFQFISPLAFSRKGSTLVALNKSCMNMSASHADFKSCLLRSMSESEPPRFRDPRGETQSLILDDTKLLLVDYFHLLLFCLLYFVKHQIWILLTYASIFACFTKHLKTEIKRLQKKEKIIPFK